MNPKQDKSFGDILCVVITGGIALVFLLFLFSNCAIDKFSSIAMSVCACISLIASFGLIYVTKNVSESVNKLSIEAKREDDYTQAIIKYRDELYRTFQELRKQNNNECFSRISAICSNLLYYTQNHPSIKDKQKIKQTINELKKHPKSYAKFEEFDNAINDLLSQ